MQITVFDFGILITHANSNIYHFFNIGDKNSLERFFETNAKRNFVSLVNYLDVPNTDIDLPGYTEMMSYLFSTCTSASFKSYSMFQLEDKIDCLPDEIYKRKVITEVI